MIEIGTIVKCANKNYNHEIVGTVDSKIYNDEKKIIGYAVTNNCNSMDLYVDDYLLFSDWDIRKKS
jgi:hypothetical protein